MNDGAPTATGKTIPEGAKARVADAAAAAKSAIAVAAVAGAAVPGDATGCARGTSQPEQVPNVVHGAANARLLRN